MKNFFVESYPFASILFYRKPIIRNGHAKNHESSKSAENDKIQGLKRIVFWITKNGIFSVTLEIYILTYSCTILTLS